MAGDLAPTVEQAAGMDYPEHLRTASNVWKFTKILTVAVVSVVVMLGIGGVGHDWGIAGLGIILTLVATAVGLARTNGDWKPVLGVMLVISVLAILFG